MAEDGLTVAVAAGDGSTVVVMAVEVHGSTVGRPFYPAKLRRADGQSAFQATVGRFGGAKRRSRRVTQICALRSRLAKRLNDLRSDAGTRTTATFLPD